MKLLIYFCGIVLFVATVAACAGCPAFEVTTRELVAMEIGGTIYGSFFLASGVIGEEEYLFYWAREGIGYVRKQAPTAASIVIESDDPPRVESFVTANGWGYRVWRFYVPRGTIIPSFNMMRFDK